MAGDIASLGISVSVDGAKQAVSDLDNLSSSSGKAEKSAAGLTSGLGLLKGALGALGVTLGLMAVKNAADGWSDMTSRLALTVGSAEKASAVMERLQSVAKNTYSDINTTTESFIANAGVLKELGKSTAQALDYTEALNNALVVSGAKAETAASVQEALSRAMALGKLQGDNLNTVLAKGGRVTQALADELGVSTLQLRQLGADGEITGDVLYNALTKRVVELREEAEKMPATLGDAGTAWGNAFTVIIGTVDQATGASGALGQALYDMGYEVADYANKIAQVFVAAQIIIGNAYTVISWALSSLTGDFDSSSALIIAGTGLLSMAFAQLSYVLLTSVVGAFKAVGAAMLANPFGLLIGAIGAAITASYLFRDELAQIFGFDVIDAAKDSVNKIIGAFVAGYNIIVKYWENLPAMFSAIGAKAWNALIEQFEAESLWIEIGGKRFTLFDGLDLSGFKKNVTDTQKDIIADAKSIWDDALAEDYVGALSTGLEKVWKSADEAVSKIKDLNAELEGDAKEPAGGALGASGDKGKGGKGGRSRADRAAEKIAREMQHRLEALQDGLRTEEEARAAAYLRDLETLQWHLENKKLTEQEYLFWRERLEADHQAKLNEIRVQQYTGALDAASDFFGAMSSMQDSGNAGMLKAQKVFSAASALINAYLAASQALADPTIPFWGKFAAVAAVLAKGMSLVAAIRSGSKSSSGGGGGGSASAPQASAAPPAKQQSTQQAIELKMHGEVFTKQTVADLIEKINEMGSDNHQLIIRTA